MTSGSKLTFMQAGANHEANEIGVRTPEPTPVDVLGPGEVGEFESRLAGRAEVAFAAYVTGTADYTILVEGDPALFNQYAVILINPQRHAHIKAEEGQKFVDWILSQEGQDAIAAFRIGDEQLFFPNAAGPAPE